jgi:hypothetical protein
MMILGQTLLIEWHKLQPGTSFFVPCVDRAAVQKQIVKEAKRLKIERLIFKHVVENNIYGLRVWRENPIILPHSASPIREV